MRIWFFWVWLLASCAPLMERVASPEAPTAAEKSGFGEEMLKATYRLDVGDRVRVIVFGEPDLSSPETGFEVNSAGFISVPLIGPVLAKGLTVEELERAIEAKLKEGYLKNPRVSVEILHYRPFYILGEVNQPGSYPYVNGLTVKQAAAIAGGFTYRADQGDIYIERQGKRFKADLDTPVLPGDTIWVPERFF